MTKWSKTLVVGTALYLGWRLVARSSRQQRRSDLAETLSRWEGEGGNVPDVPEVEPAPRRGRAESESRRGPLQ